MKKWEYGVITFDKGLWYFLSNEPEVVLGENQNFMKYLNNAGENGWELVSTIEKAISGFGFTEYTFKREI